MGPDDKPTVSVNRSRSAFLSSRTGDERPRSAGLFAKEVGHAWQGWAQWAQGSEERFAGSLSRRGHERPKLAALAVAPIALAVMSAMASGECSEMAGLRCSGALAAVDSLSEEEAS
jgi:hypothetical protein